MPSLFKIYHNICIVVEKVIRNICKIRKTVTILPVLILATSLITWSFRSENRNVSPERTHLFLSVVNKLHVQENLKYLYLGMEQCASVCHNNEEMGYQYDIMRNGPHSRSYIILAGKKAARFAKNINLKESSLESAVCLRCHVTGGGLDSSSFSATYKKEEGVTCEACHKGEFITKTYLPEEKDCLVCHNNSVHKIKKFNYIINREKIAHPRPKAQL